MKGHEAKRLLLVYIWAFSVEMCRPRAKQKLIRRDHQPFARGLGVKFTNIASDIFMALPAALYNIVNIEQIPLDNSILVYCIYIIYRHMSYELQPEFT